MIIHLHGLDSYRRGEKLRELVHAYRAKYADADILSVDLAEDPEAWRTVADFLAQPSMFVDSKVAVVRESGEVGEKGWIETLKAQTKSPKTFIIISDAAAPKKDFRFLARKPVQSQTFAVPEGAELSAFVKREAAKLDVRIDPAALALLARAASGAGEGALWFASAELQKLALVGAGREIGAADLRAELRENAREQVFALARAMLSARGTGARLVALERTLAQNDAPAYLFNSLGFQSHGAAAAALADYDVAVKSGALEYEEALLGFALL